MRRVTITLSLKTHGEHVLLHIQIYKKINIIIKPPFISSFFSSFEISLYKATATHSKMDLHINSPHYKYSVTCYKKPNVRRNVLPKTSF